MKIYGTKTNVYDAVDAVVSYGVAAVEGEKTPAVEYAERIIACLAPYADVNPAIGYKNVKNNGYLYYVYNLNAFSHGSYDLEKMVDRIDEANE